MLSRQCEGNRPRTGVEGGDDSLAYSVYHTRVDIVPREVGPHGQSNRVVADRHTALVLHYCDLCDALRGENYCTVLPRLQIHSLNQVGEMVEKGARKDVIVREIE